MTAAARRRLAPEIFALAVRRLGVFSNGRRNRSFEAASMVMVDGCPMAQAVRICGVRRQAVYNAMKRVEAAFESIGICPSCGRRLDVTGTAGPLEPSVVRSRQREELNAE